jgi:aminocarboxymuconate-semialdehyde decarboxylase
MCEAARDRLWWLATVPLQDVERSLSVLEDAITAGCVGVQIGTSVAGARLDDERFAPFWQAAERLRLPVTLHPAYVERSASLGAFYLENVIGFPLETTVAIERLICAGVLDRHPHLQVGFFTAAATFPIRPAACDTRAPFARSSPPADPWAYLGQLWFDVITHDRGALRYLIDRVSIERLVLGTDLPFDMALPAPLSAVAGAGGDRAVEAVAELNPRRLYPPTAPSRSV